MLENKMEIESLTLNDFNNICCGEFYGDNNLLIRNIESIATEINEIKKSCLYFCKEKNKEKAIIKIKEAIINGALCCITDKENLNIYPIIYVNDVEKTIKELSEHFRKRIDIPIIAVTGSVGKTCTKDMCTSVLSQELKALKTRYYQNIAVHYADPLYKLLKNNYNIAVFEAALGASYMMVENSCILKPDIVIMTCIGESHLDKNNTQEEIFRAKSQIFDYMSNSGTAYVNGCDKFLRNITLNEPRKVKWFGISEEMEFHPENIINLGLKGTNCDLVYKNERINVTIPVPGMHFINAALPSFAIGLEFGLSKESIKNGIEEFKTSVRRSKVYNLESMTIIEDCYNASPTSMKANIDMLKTLSGRKVFIMGDMVKLGDNSESYHIEVVEYAIKNDIDLIIYAGMYKEKIEKSLFKEKNKNNVICMIDKEMLLDKLTNLINKDDIVLIKASNIYKFEDVTTQLKQIKI